MLFPTVEFGLFFVATFFASWWLKDALTQRKVLLLIASYTFYAVWDWRFTALLFLSSAFNYLLGHAIARSEGAGRRRALVAVAVTGNLAVLGAFKYFGFFVENAAVFLTAVGFERDLPILEIILPVGISFFTFQGISYILDVARKKIKAVDNPIDLLLFISFFPQLVAGPIVRAADFLPQLARAPRLDDRTVVYGFALIVFGLFKKVVVATYLSTEIVYDAFLDPTSYSSADLLFASYAFAVQVYCDFSAYSDIAIGVAALLGFTFKPNFDRPLAATSLEQLWRRWHISLSSFLRDYLYKNLRGEDRSEISLWRATFLTMLIGGLWHGAAWTFVIWGAIHGAFLVFERVVKRRVKPAIVGAAERVGVAGGFERATAVFGWVVAFHVFAFAAIFFRAPDLPLATSYFETMLAFTGGLELATPFVVGLIVYAVGLQFLPRDLAGRAADRFERAHPIALGAAVGLAMVVIFKMAEPGVAPFIYFQF